MSMSDEEKMMRFTQDILTFLQQQLNQGWELDRDYVQFLINVFNRLPVEEADNRHLALENYWLAKQLEKETGSAAAYWQIHASEFADGHVQSKKVFSDEKLGMAMEAE